MKPKLLIDEAHDKFSWLEERYKEFKKDQEIVQAGNSQAFRTQA